MASLGCSPALGDADFGEEQQQHPNAGGPAFILLPGVARAEQLWWSTCSRNTVWAAAGEFCQELRH